MKTALLISTYNWKEALNLVLESVQVQTKLPDEILIADDGSREETQKLIHDWQKKSNIPIKHFWQEDNGFRKTIIMNRAIAGTEADYIIQIDGDILLEKHFIEDHLTDCKKGFFIKGSRALINEPTTKTILNQQNLDWRLIKANIKNKINATRNTLLAPLFRKDKIKSNNLKGCNFSFWKKDFVQVNGYNNDICGWGHEDIELAARLSNIGIKQRQLKMKAVCFHLHHAYFDRSNENDNFGVYRQVIEKKITTCENGYLQSIEKNL